MEHQIDESKPGIPLSQSEVQAWLEVFASDTKENTSASDRPKPGAKQHEKEPDWNPFPPGYGEDLLDK